MDWQWTSKNHSKSYFIKAEDEAAYLEIHHLRQLANGGSDTIQNAVVVCSNCHREFHFGSCKPEQTQKLYQEK